MTRTRAGLVVAAAVLLALPWVTGAYTVYLVNLISINVILATGLVLLTGLTGQLSLGNAAFFAAGSYISALATVTLGAPYLVSLLLGAVGATVLGVVVGLPALRLEGLYLALATLGLGKAVQLIALHWKSVTNGANGLAVPKPVLFGLPIVSDTRFFYVVTITTLALLWVARNLVRSGVGRALVALRESGVAASASGIHLARYKTLAFAVSAFYSGLAGGLHASMVGFIEPEEFGIWASISYLIMVVVGGMASLAGGVVGAIVLTVLPELLRWSQEFKELIFGALLLVVLLVMPGGIVGTLARAWRRLRPTVDRARPVTTSVVGAVMGATATRTPARDGRQDAPVLAIDDLVVRFGGLVAVDRFSLRVRDGETVALIGPNGAGKTTVLNVVDGLQRATSGAVSLLGADASRVRPDQLARRGVTRTFQRVQLFRSMTALDNVLVGLDPDRRTGIARAAVAAPAQRREEHDLRERARHALTRVGLATQTDTIAATLPFGHQRLLELARAIVAEPRLLLLDEPASGLDPDEGAELITVLETLRRESGVTILIVEHVLPVVRRIADRVVVLHYGRTIAEGSFDAVKSEPAVIEAYLGVPDAGDVVPVPK